MLVLSRRPNETVTFPTLGIAVEILRIQGHAVRVGIVAPESIPVLRGELPPKVGMVPPRDHDHEVRGQLNAATMAIYLAQKQLESGQSDDAEATLGEALRFLSKLETTLRPPTARPVTRSPRPLRALLVEDNANEQSLLCSYLRLSGMEVMAVNDGLDALKHLQSHEHPDALLLDLQMPRCDGPTTLAAIRAEQAYESLKVFIVSGSEPDVVKPIHRIDGWFRKPLNPAGIVEALSQAIQSN